MKKIILLILIYLSVFTVVIAQSKINFSFAKNIQDQETNANQQVSMLIQGNVVEIEVLVKGVGGHFNFSTSTIASVSISINQLSQIISNKAIQRVAAFPPAKQPLNDSMLFNSNITPVHNAQSPLLQAYDGASVIVGFIDTGIDITHPDFWNSAGSTRILWLWDQTKPVAANTPTVSANGQEWSKADIDAGLASSHTDPGGHGTHVAGVGVGNGLATGKFKGVAPKADIIFVAYDFTKSLMVEAVKYIYDKAAIAGKPCVINASLGGDYGMHDGLDLESQAIKSLINARAGQAFIAAAGNSGAKGTCHLAYTVSPTDTNYTLFAPSGGKVYMNIIADSSNLVNVKFAIGADNMAPHSFRGNIPFLPISSITLGVPVTTSLVVGGKQIGKIQYYLDKVNGVYDLQFFITPDSASYNWRLMATGIGKFDLWNYNSAGNSYVPIVNSAATIATFSDAAAYKFPDANKSIQGGFQCLDEVIAVGNYQNRASYIDCNSNPYVDPTKIPGQLISTSSVGPTRDGRLKPEITASGDMTMAAASLQLRNNPSFKPNMAEGCFHIRNGGTSHASPIVAGLAALYLQKNNTATMAQLRNAIIGSASQDVFTGHEIPNNSWGYGKVDGYGAMIETLLVTSPPLNKSVCENSSITFSVSTTGASAKTYLWQVNKGIGFIDLINVPPYSGVTAATLTITATPSTLNGYKYRCLVSNAYASDVTSDAAVLTVFAKPIITASASASTLCAGTMLTLFASGGKSYAWTGGANNGVAFAAPTLNTSYTVTGTDVNNCINTATVTISVVPLPVVTLSGLAANYCFDAAPQTLTGAPAGGTYSGTGITNAIAGIFDPVVAGVGVKTITYTYTDANNCNGVASKSALVLTQVVSADSCPTIIMSHMDENIANIFTPNNDGLNDEFKVNYTGTPASDFNLSVFDRWGVLVFSSTNPNVKWDGRTTAGLKVSTGTYFYVLVNSGVRYKGYVALFE